MNVPTLIVLILLAAAIVAAELSINSTRKKRGSSCIWCEGCALKDKCGKRD
ncbi:MAG: hypothetical protein J5699_08745 [Bacteroidales bacterium]|nr:hypothetical protein [Bacteroidales bacterium]